MIKNRVTPFVSLIALFFICASASFAVAQKITANNTTDSIKGCAPFVGVQFKGLNGATNIAWDFKDGASASLPDPVHTFGKPGVYNVSYSATVNGNTVNQTIQIKVFGKPTPLFTIKNPMGCSGLIVAFKDSSKGGGGVPISSWKWTFGDGGFDNSNNTTPSHQYQSKGSFDISLTVTDINGCDSAYTLTNVISISQKPTMVVTSSPASLNSCTVPYDLDFDASTSVSGSPKGGGLTYSWNFANGSTSTLPNPNKTSFTAAGTYPVKVVVEDNNKCKDSLVRTVIVGGPLASFKTQDTVCKGAQVVFHNHSTGFNPFWNYGDGTSGTDTTHAYANAGTYVVTLSVFSGNCQDDTVRKVVVEDVFADFKLNQPTYSCSTPVTFSFTNTSTPSNLTYSWTFVGDWPVKAYPDTSTKKNPSITVNNPDTNQYSIYEKDSYVTATLTVTSSHGCKATKILSDTVHLVTARYTVDKVAGCVPLSVNFFDSSLSKEKIKKWTLFFGDGTNTTVTTGFDAPVNPPINHVYTNTGTYYSYLVVENEKGCIDTSYAIKIDVGKPANPNFSATPLTACIGDTIKFTDLTPLADSVDSWHYISDGTMLSHCPGDPNPSWVFVNTTGPQNVTLAVTSHGCASTVTKSNYINIKGPLANYRIVSDCDSPLVYTFIGSIQDATTWTWDFGDGATITNSTLQTVTHKYLQHGNYPVKLIATNPGTGCSNSTDIDTARVRVIKASFSLPKDVCLDASAIVYADSSEDVAASCYTGYTWLWGDTKGPGITHEKSLSHSYSSYGTKTIKLIVKDINGCRDTAVKTINVSTVFPGYKVSTDHGCMPLQITFTDTSHSDTTLTAWSWSLGDNTNPLTNDTITHTYTTLPPVSTNPLQKDKYKVTVVITNALGCTASRTSYITPSIPDSAFSVNKTKLCVGDSVKFTPGVNSQNHSGYKWTFGDGDTSVIKSPYHTFNSAGTFTVVMNIKDSIGCPAKNKTSVNVEAYPQVGFSFASQKPLGDFCWPVPIQFTDTSKASVFLSRSWDLANGSSSTLANQTVAETYTTPGSYPISLTVTTQNGCSKKFTKQIEIEGATAGFTFGPTTICKGQSSTFTIKDTSRVFTWHWDFGDGFDTTAVSPITHTFNHHPANGQGYVQLIIWAKDSTCQKPYAQNIAIHQVVADFNRNNEINVLDTAHCLSIADLFTNNSTNASSYAWNFGDGVNANSASPTHTYAAAGTYTVTLSIVNTTTGCVDTLQKPMIIFPLPNPVASGGDTCVGSPVQINSSGGLTYSWTPATGLSSTNTSNPLAQPSQTTTYTVTVGDANNCTKTTTAFVYIQQKPPQVYLDTTIIIGEGVTMFHADAGGSFIYSWNPSDSLSCGDCPRPYIQPFSYKEYTVTLKDTLGCFTADSYFKIHVDPKSSLDVPTAFTPNGDGINDVIYVDGWGIKKLLEFKIYNRWGELVFVSTDLSVGWDGTFKGVPQNIETYAYTVTAETYIDKEPLTKKGFIKLLK